MDPDEFDEFDEGEEEGEEEEELDPKNPEHAFILLERNFTKTVAEIEQNPQIASYAEEYNKLFEAVYKSREEVKELTQHIGLLDASTDMLEEKLELALKLAEADSATISTLKAKIEQVWKLADNAHDREQQAQEIIDNLRNQINGLTTEIEFKNKMGLEGPDDAELSKNQEVLQREKERLMLEAAQLQQKLTNALGYQEELERKNSQADLKINEISGQLEDQTSELERTKKIRDKLLDDIKELNTEIGHWKADSQRLQAVIVKEEKNSAKLERIVTEQTSAKESVIKELDLANQKGIKLLEDFHKIREQYEATKKELHNKTNSLKQKEDEVGKMKTEMSKFASIRENYDKRLSHLQNEKLDVCVELDKVRQTCANMEKDIDKYKKQSDMDKRSLDSMVREKDILNKNVLRHQALLRDHIKLIKIQVQTKKKLELELDEYATESGKLRKQINHLEKERDRMVDEQLDLARKIEDSMDEIKLRKAEIYNVKKALAENETRLRMQQNLFEGVRAERNSLQKALQESTSECMELKSKLKISSHQGEQLKEDIAAKEQQLIREETILRKITKEKDNLRVELDNAVENIKQLKIQISEMSTELKRLHKVISDSDRTIRQQAKDLEQLMNERDILGSQLVRRNDELALLYEKIRILQSTLHRGEAHYDRRLEDIRLLKIEVRRLRQEKHLLTKSITNMTDLRLEVFHLERDLTRERLKCRALEEELQTPLNVHRWRKLEGSDPTVLELLQKVQLLQKRLLHQAADAVERERQLKESEKLYINLRQVLSKQPGPSVKTELVKTQRALTMRGNKMKCLVSELNMTEGQVLEYKQELEKLREELKLLKQKGLLEKKAQQQLPPVKNATSKDPNQAGDFNTVKFTGGGYKMAVNSVNNTK